MAATDPSPFGILLRQYRVEADLTQEELAERALLSVRAISDLERGVKHAPRLHTVRQLADALALEDEERSRFTAAARRTHQPSLQPVRTRTRCNLPDEPTSFVGRREEVTAVSALLTHERVRLVTLTGTGGTGKTRLALQIAAALLDAFEDGVVFVPLASIATAELVGSAIMQALALKDMRGRQPLEALSAYLDSKHLLLILDNLERLLGAGPLIAALLDACPELRILVTSRAPLHLACEREHAVPPLAVPDHVRLPALEDLARCEAVALFVERAREARSSFTLSEDNAAAVAEICARLDGLPLALELAAARIKLFPPAALLPRLTHRLQLLTGGPRDRPARHQTLRATIDWSHDLLTGDEQCLFARLSVFSGGCAFAAAAAVCNPDGTLDLLEGLTSLVDKGLVSSVGSEEPRFVMLELLREYAAEQLAERGERDELRDRHAGYFCEAGLPLGEDAGPAAQEARIAWVAAEIDNLRAAMDWAAASGNLEPGLRILGSPLVVWGRQGHFAEVARRGEELLAVPGTVDPALRARALRTTSDYTRLAGDWARAMCLAEEAVRLARGTGDAALTAWCLTSLGAPTYLAGDYERAEAIYAEAVALADRAGDAVCIAFAQHLLAYALFNRGQRDRPRELWERSLDYYRTAGDESSITLILHNLAELEWREGNPCRAGEHVLEGLVLAERVRRALIPVYIQIGAAMTVDGGEPELGALLLGAYESAAIASGRGKNADHLAIERWIVEHGTTQIGGEDWQRTWEDGRQMSVEEAIELTREYAMRLARIAPLETDSLLERRRRRGIRLVR